MSLTDTIKGLDDPKQFTKLTDDQFRSLVGQVIQTQFNDRRENQLLYYKPVSATAERVHQSQARYCCVGGGNGASKTDTMLAELAMLTTGVIPQGLDPKVEAAIRLKFRGPVAVRVVVESLTTTLYPIILPKLQWWKWNGASEPGGDKGHWGWVPRRALITGSWVRSWQDKLRVLRVLCFNPENPDEVLGESVWQFMSKDQDPSDFASGDYHHILHDELPTYAIWRENEARTMRVGGRMALAMTWPDDPSIPVDWAYDQLYEKGQPGPNKAENVDWFEMWSTENQNIIQQTVAEQAETWDEEIRAVRIYGRPIRFSNRIHPLFTDQWSTWCVRCQKPKWPGDEPGRCQECGGELVEYNHVQEFPVEGSLPTIMLLDPHPRKPHYLLWAQIDTWDDVWVVAEALVSGGADETAETVRQIEESLGLRTSARLGDPNMLASPSGQRRGVSWRDEFDAVGLMCDFADDSDVGRSRLNDYLKVDPDRRKPRVHVHPRCVETIKQIKRYVWEDWKHTVDRGQKQTPKDKDDDMPTLLKYLMNFEPRFEALARGDTVIHTRGREPTPEAREWPR